ncbi:MAG: phosphomethylpyrimidine synthase ThiC, partial [Actinobacteria bacterium]
MSTIDDIRAGREVVGLAEAAVAEGVGVDALAEAILAGRVAILANRSRRGVVRPVAVGEGLRTKVNANIGASEDASSPEEELRKLDAAVRAGADGVMDLSTGGDLVAMRRALLALCPVPLGTVPVYEAAVRAGAAVEEMTADDLLGVVRRQAEEGVDFQTIHAALTREQAESALASDRLAGIVSRGGALLAAWMVAHDAENPLFERFDEVLEVCRRHDVTISLGDSLRPGALADAGDGLQTREARVLGELVRRCRDAGVQAMVEGPGHVPLHRVASQIRDLKEACDGAPLYVLGPLVVDIAPGYDHITASIGGAAAAAAGADFLCYVTRAEHVCLPDTDDVAEGVIAARIAAHAGDIAKAIPGARDRDDAMSRARKALDWEAQYAFALDHLRPREMRRRAGAEEGACAMCG